MLVAVFVLNLLLTACAIALVQRRSPGHLHLLSMVLVSLFVAYPFKCLLVSSDPWGFMTFEHDPDPFNYLFINIFYFVNVLACMLAVTFFMPRAERNARFGTEVGFHPTFWLLSMSVVLIVAYRELYFDYFLDFSLVKNELRRKSLEAQVGAGWITVLMLGGLPLVYFTIRSRAPLLMRGLAVGLFVSVLLVVGSRQYLLGSVLLASVALMGFSPVRALTVLGGLAAAASLIGMASWHEDQGFILTMALERFMHTYDGFDLFAAYLQSSHRLLWGSTIFEDIVITYIPRFLWPGKPFLFGSNELVASMYPDLSDTESLVATFPSGFFLEQYANFSYFGVLLAFAFYALLCRFPNTSRFKGRFVYLGAFAFTPTFFRSGASFITLILMLSLLAFVIEGLEFALAGTLTLARAGLRRATAAVS